MFVKPDNNSKSGNYSIIVEAGAMSSNETSGMEILPQRLIKFVVDLRGAETSEEVESNISSEGNNTNESENSELIPTREDIENSSYIYFVIVFLILLISIIFYKKS